MNLPILAPLLTAVSVPIVLPLLNTVGLRRSRRLASLGVYNFSPGIRIFLWIGTTLWIACPFIFELTGVTLSHGDWLAALATDVFLLSCSLYADRYVVILGSDSIRYGAFFRKEVSYDQIVSMKTHISNSGTEYCDLKFSGGGAKLDGNMQRFDDLLEKLKTRTRESTAC